MSTGIEKVIDWYSTKASYDYMPEATKNGLKLWEREVEKQYFTQKSQILDIGCGMGREAFTLYDLGYQVTGVDISEPIIKQAIQLANQTGRKIVFKITNGLDLPFADETFDIVILQSHTFGLIYGDENKIHILNECRRVLKENGISSFSSHDIEYVMQNYPQYLDGNKFWAYADCYWEAFSINDLKAYAIQVGFHVLNCQHGKIYKPEDGTINHCVCKK